MMSKKSFWIALVIITALSWIDYQFLSEGEWVRDISENKRRVGHFFILLTVMAVGYLSLRTNVVLWLQKLWVFSYLVVVAVLIGSGTLAYTGHLPVAIADVMSNGR